MIGVGERAQTGEVCGRHGQSFAGVEAGNQRRPNQKATFTSRISTGTSTSGTMTAAKATGEASPKAATATAMVSSKLLPAAVKAPAVVRGEALRSAARRVGIECVMNGRSRGSR